MRHRRTSREQLDYWLRYTKEPLGASAHSLAPARRAPSGLWNGAAACVRGFSLNAEGVESMLLLPRERFQPRRARSAADRTAHLGGASGTICADTGSGGDAPSLSVRMTLAMMMREAA
jgi:hypothetical protein